MDSIELEQHRIDMKIRQYNIDNLLNNDSIYDSKVENIEKAFSLTYLIRNNFLLYNDNLNIEFMYNFDNNRVTDIYIYDENYFDYIRNNFMDFYMCLNIISNKYIDKNSLNISINMYVNSGPPHTPIIYLQNDSQQTIDKVFGKYKLKNNLIK